MTIAQVLTVYGDYVIKRYRDGYILCNLKGDYHHHGHFRKYKTCLTLIKLMEKREIPKSFYLRESILRISTDEKYKQNIKIKINKDKNKEKYININKGRK